MKEFVISEAQTEKAVLVGLITQNQNERKTNEYLDELAFLAETAGAEVVNRFTQKLDTPNSVTYVGKGKLQEIKDYLLQMNEDEETEIVVISSVGIRMMSLITENSKRIAEGRFYV